MRLRVGSRIRHVEIDGNRVLLDLTSESYRVLDSVGSAMWSALVGERHWDDIREELSKSYDVSLTTLDSDLSVFETDCCAQGLLEADGQQPDTTVVGRDYLRTLGDGILNSLPGTLGAVLTLYTTRYWLTWRGFHRTYLRYGSLPCEPVRVEPSQAVAQFNRAENMFLAKRAPNDCLVRSLSLFRHLRARGIAAEHVIGVCRMPFQAHAWVELEGQPILDAFASNGIFVPIARIACNPDPPQ